MIQSSSTYYILASITGISISFKKYRSNFLKITPNPIFTVTQYCQYDLDSVCEMVPRRCNPPSKTEILVPAVFATVNGNIVK